MKKVAIAIIAAVMLTGCRQHNDEADAYGNFEAEEVIISSETGGRIILLVPEEGTQVEKGDSIALIDTTLLHLQKSEIEAGIMSIKTRINSINAQNDILSQQIANIEVNVGRIGNMLKDDAATKKQYDDLTGQVEVLKKQIAANNTQKISTSAEINVYQSKKATVGEQIRRSLVRSPLSGTVLEKYSEEGEITAAGKPLVKLADLKIIRLKVYISGAQIGRVRIGQECTVRTDDGEKGYRSYRGTVSRVSDKAEFTPKIIQTKDERVTLVYAVTVDVHNDGTLKSGMPGEVIFQ